MTSFAEELVRVHEEYARNVPNNYAATIPRIAKAVSERDVPGAAEALAVWLKNINLQYYGFRPEEARVLRAELEPLLTIELQTLSEFRERSTATFDKADESEVSGCSEFFGRSLVPSEQQRRSTL